MRNPRLLPAAVPRYTSGQSRLLNNTPDELIMNRRDFIKKSTIAAGLASSVRLLAPLAVSESSAQAPLAQTQLSVGRVSPMQLAERVRRKIVPRRGFCSIAPGTTPGEALISGNGAVNIELAGDPYTEQIPFRHENLFVPSYEGPSAVM